MHLHLGRERVNSGEQKLRVDNAVKGVATQGAYCEVVPEKEGRHLGSNKLDDGWPESETCDCPALSKRYIERVKERVDVKE